MTTYVQVKPPGYDRAIVVRTEESRQRASKRAVLKTPNFTMRFTAQEIAAEKHLSRSKPYPNKGRNEAGRRVAREARRLDQLESKSLAACDDFDVMKREQESDAA